MTLGVTTTVWLTWRLMKFTLLTQDVTPYLVDRYSEHQGKRYALRLSRQTI
jgi:hypothetical protein